MRTATCLLGFLICSASLISQPLTLHVRTKEKVGKYQPGDSLHISTAKRNATSGAVQYQITDNGMLRFIDADRFEPIDGGLPYWLNTWLEYRSQPIFNSGWQHYRRRLLREAADEYLLSLEEQSLLFKDAYLEDYLFSVASRIFPEYQQLEYPGHLGVKILNSTRPAAFALANGVVLLSTGLLAHLESEEELTAIIAVQIAHQVLDHNLINFNRDIRNLNIRNFMAGAATLAAAAAMTYSNLEYESDFDIRSASLVGRGVYALADAVMAETGAGFTGEQLLAAQALAKGYLSTRQIDGAALDRITVRMLKATRQEGPQAESASPVSMADYQPLPTVRMNVPADTEIARAFVRQLGAALSHHAWQLYYTRQYELAQDFTDRLIATGAATETDYLLRARLCRVQANTPESNREALRYLSFAQQTAGRPFPEIWAEAGLLHLRLGDRVLAREAFLHYASLLEELLRINPADTYPGEKLDWCRRMLLQCQ
ncbi:MAG: M48 family metalloprotease [Bacteroidia bacterium]|nr:M48 family metalloprotease [Bacteroidia bacterium]